MRLVDKSCHGFMQRHVLRGKIVIVVVVGIKVLQFLLINGNLYGTQGSLALEEAAVGVCGNGPGQGRVQPDGDEQLLAPVPSRILIAVGLDLLCLDGLVEQVVIGKYGKRLQHAL